MKDILFQLQFITPDHYNDIVEERAVSKLCGYPVCGKTLSNVRIHSFSLQKLALAIYTRFFRP